MLEPEYAVAGCAERRIEGRRNRYSQRIAGVDRVDDSIIPKFGGRIVGGELLHVSFARLVPKSVDFLLLDGAAVARHLIDLYLRQGVRRLVAAHHADLMVWPSE